MRNYRETERESDREIKECVKETDRAARRKKGFLGAIIRFQKESDDPDGLQFSGLTGNERKEIKREFNLNIKAPGPPRAMGITST